MKKLRRLISIVIIIAFLVIPSILIAQPPPDPCPDPMDPDCPIDSGLVFLMAAVILIALKKAYDFKKAHNTSNR